MNEKTRNIYNINLTKKIHKSKQSINLNLVNLDQMVTSDKIKHGNDGFQYFIGYKEDEIVKPLCIILPQTSWCIKCCEKGEKNMSFVIKDENVLDIYNEIWSKIKKILNIKFHSISVYDKKYIKAKVREFNGLIKSNSLGNEIPKEGVHNY